ncbi:cupin domain-containing protein [Marinomonas ostreistagni]|uniref:(R)-mandelonitrile lyase n=1 Tax=Marinomonas ostreistagni TaxID=359209 RepID=UPI001EF1DA74|nr:cupin domain-containing protein [Marinomonas ostreistagni]
MKKLITVTMVTLMAGSALAADVEITRAGTQKTVIGSDDLFTGTSIINPVFAPNEHRDFSAGEVTFHPGARSNWHTHPEGQTLVITSGTGWTQQEGEARQVIKAGDVVWCPPGVKHWHGATDTTSMTHYAIQAQNDEGSVVDWMEPVTDEQYLGE